MILLKELQSSLENTGFVFDAFNSDSVQISGLPIGMAESEISIVLEELIGNLQNEIPESSFSQSDSIAKSMAVIAPTLISAEAIQPSVRSKIHWALDSLSWLVLILKLSRF